MRSRQRAGLVAVGLVSLGAVACGPILEWLSRPSLTLETVGRGVLKVIFSPPRLGGAGGARPPDVRYATTPITDSTWPSATAVSGPWETPAKEGAGRLQATVSGLAPVVHYFAARAERRGATVLSEIATALPLREAAVHGKVAGAFFGHTIAMVGDVGGDGYADLIVGAPWSDEGLEHARSRWVRRVRRILRALRFSLHGGKAGAAFVFPGSPRGVTSTPLWTIFGKADGEFLGSSLAGLGDVNGDGLADIAVGIPGYDARLRDEGAVALYYGRRGPPPSEPDLILSGRTRDESFGAAVAGLGDVNRDGYPDVAIGAPGSNLGAPNGGAVFIHHGGPAGIDRTPATVLVGTTFDGLFGSAVVGVGDVNGDGYADVLIGAYEGVGDFRAAGAAYLYHGNARGLSPVPALVLRGLRGGDQFGSALAALGDVDRDGFADFAVAAPKHSDADDEAGAVFVFHGGPRGADAAPRAVLRGPWPRARFGSSLAGVGDQDGDGFPDLAVGAVEAVLLFRGGPSGIGSERVLVLRDGLGADPVGRTIAGGQDLDGDGIADFAIGAPESRARGSSSGSVFVRY